MLTNIHYVVIGINLQSITVTSSKYSTVYLTEFHTLFEIWQISVVHSEWLNNSCQTYTLLQYCNNNKYFAHCKYGSGGNNGSQPGHRAHAVNPCAPAGPRQASRRHSFCYAAPVCCVSLYHFTHQKRLTFWRSKHQKVGLNFPIFSGVTPLDPFTGRGYPIPYPPQHVLGIARDASAHVLGPRPIMPVRSYVAPLVPQQEQTPGAATEYRLLSLSVFS